ncbi:hypothetical protein HU200_060808 [Digitaria exilis]|uniref:Endonuclease/exonuclease/phosphatase domain-containing protein n=1 Tax=Digitaria exilis TaxID=1010633 RepID=A0A835A5X6_9POAL|nr:hypothetical protein HU200_060808 [Digitaria exilis]
MEPASFKKLLLSSWNVRGLGDSDKCRDVRYTLSSTPLHVICLQETKLSDVAVSKASSFLPSNLTNFTYKNSNGASGGLLNAWTYFFESTVDSLSFAVTNVYGPCRNDQKENFLNELRFLSTTCTGPWLIFGDFNLTRVAEDKNTENFSNAAPEAFNDIIDELLLNDLPLLDHRFTWSNGQDNPTLVRLDRALINVPWGQALFNSTLTSLVRHTSDHVPLLLTATSTAPVSQIFRYQKFWAAYATYKNMVLQVWEAPVNQVADSAQQVVEKLKWVRVKSKKFAKDIKCPKEIMVACQHVIALIDIMEELRSLTLEELLLRTPVKEQLSTHNKALSDY